MGVEARVVLEERGAPSEAPAGAWTDAAIPAQLLVPWTARAAGPVEHLTVAGSVNVARIGHIDRWIEATAHPNRLQSLRVLSAARHDLRLRAFCKQIPHCCPKDAGSVTNWRVRR